MERRKPQRVLDRLGQAIVAGRYAAGAKLPTEDDLARKLGVAGHRCARG